MRDLHYYEPVFMGFDKRIYFLEENGSCSLLMFKDAGSTYNEYEAIVAVDEVSPLLDYPTSKRDITLAERMQQLFGRSDGYTCFVKLCEENNVEIKEIQW